MYVYGEVIKYTSIQDTMARFDCEINNCVLFILAKVFAAILAVIIAIIGSIIIVIVSVLVFVLGLPLFTLGFLILIPMAYLVRVSISILSILTTC